MVINSDENTRSITKETTEVFSISEHEEADTRLFFHAGMSNEATVIVPKDSEVFLLLIYSLGQFDDFATPPPLWYMKIDFDPFSASVALI